MRFNRHISYRVQRAFSPAFLLSNRLNYLLDMYHSTDPFFHHDRTLIFSKKSVISFWFCFLTKLMLQLSAIPQNDGLNIITLQPLMTHFMTYQNINVQSNQKKTQLQLKIINSTFSMNKQESLAVQKQRISRTNTFLQNLQLPSEGNDDKKTTLRRRVSCDESKTIKKTDTPNSPIRMSGNGLEKKLNYRVSSDVISFEMDQQRTNQMRTISSDQQLEAYYLAFKKLFFILYQTSHFLMENMFKLTTDMYQNKRIVFLCLIFQNNKEGWDLKFLNKLLPLARNINFLASNPNQFERRIDLVARKVTLQNDKRQKIKNAFLNPKIQRTWEQVIEAYYCDEEIEAFVDDQFDTPEQKMCFIQVKEFIINKLGTETFGNQLRKYCVLQQIDDDLNLDFKFQFLLTQEFSFNAPTCLMKETPRLSEVKQNTQEDTKCPIM